MGHSTEKIRLTAAQKLWHKVRHTGTKGGRERGKRKGIPSMYQSALNLNNVMFVWRIFY